MRSFLQQAAAGPITVLLSVFCAATTLAAAARNSLPERPIFLQMPASSSAALPFSSQDLEEAVGLRAPVARTPDPSAQTVVIELLPDGIRVRSATRDQMIRLTNGSPAHEAARMVALAVIDVWRDPLDPSAGIVAVRRADGSGLSAPLLVSRFSLGATAGYQLALTSASPDREIALTTQFGIAAAPWNGAWVGLVEVGYAKSNSSNDPVVRQFQAVLDKPITLPTIPVRLGAGYWHRRFIVAAGAVARMYMAGGATLNHDLFLLPGAFASGTFLIPVVGRWSLKLIVGCEAYPASHSIAHADTTDSPWTRERYPLATNHLAPYVAAGAQWR